MRILFVLPSSSLACCWTILALLTPAKLPLHKIRTAMRLRSNRDASSTPDPGRGTMKNSSKRPLSVLSLLDPSKGASAKVAKSSSQRKQTSHTAGNLLKRWIEHDLLDFHRFSPDEAQRIQESLLDWYDNNRRRLPWRGDPPPWTGSTAGFASQTRQKSDGSGAKAKQKKQTQVTDFFVSSTSDESEAMEAEMPPTFPVTRYGVWVSEIMLQQTRVEAVIPYWVKWMQSFPTVQALAAATEDEVNAHWAGLGFYRRARYLHAGAKQVVQRCTDAEIPASVAELLELPGIGRYTASAIASICGQVAVPVVDGNVCRVLTRLRGICQHVKAPVLKDQHAWALAEALVQNTTRPGDVNQALMELGATYCAPSGTGIDPGDPLRDFYWSTQLAREVRDLVNKDGSGAVRKLLQQMPPHGKGCPVCDPDGVSLVVEGFLKAAETPEDHDQFPAVGHKLLPMAPPKSAKRVQVLVVLGVLRWFEDEADGTKKPQWLLVRRPDTGLLARQWEFPSTCLWDSANLPPAQKKKRSKGSGDPEPPALAKRDRRRAVEDWCSSSVVLKTVSQKAPLEHIFSHVKHVQWIETAIVQEEPPIDMADREWQWMGREEMERVGLTSGVQKILAVLDQHHGCKT